MPRVLQPKSIWGGSKTCKKIIIELKIFNWIGDGDDEWPKI